MISQFYWYVNWFAEIRTIKFCFFPFKFKLKDHGCVNIILEFSNIRPIKKLKNYNIKKIGKVKILKADRSMIRSQLTDSLLTYSLIHWDTLIDEKLLERKIIKIYLIIMSHKYECVPVN